MIVDPLIISIDKTEVIRLENQLSLILEYVPYEERHTFYSSVMEFRRKLQNWCNEDD